MILFNGCYFKQQSGENAIALIPAYHREKDKIKTASLQIITKDQVFMRNYPYTAMNFQENPLQIQLGEHRFSTSGITLHEQSANFSLTGELKFQQLIPPLHHIMGPFAHIPFMECYHQIWSLKHKVTGSITLNNQTYEFPHGFGYIEGDRGRSFPKRYFWTHSFFQQDHDTTTGSLMLAVADIPMGLGDFTGIIGFIFWKGKEYRFGTYLGAKVLERTKNSITISQGSYKFTATLLESKAQSLKAPHSGAMSRLIKESLQCTARYKLYKNDHLLIDVTTNHASVEFEY